MDSKTHTILHLEIGDSREVDRHSPRMEKKNFGGKGLELPGTSFTISHMGSHF